MREPPLFSSVFDPPAEHIKVGIDLGSCETRIAIRMPADPTRIRVLTLPTVLGYYRAEEDGIELPVIGRKALYYRDRMALTSPFVAEEAVRGKVIADFARELKKLCAGRRGPRPWALGALPAGGDPLATSVLQSVLGSFCERVAWADSLHLLALGLGSELARGRTLLIDLGHTSTRMVLLRGGVPSPSDVRVVPCGGSDLDGALTRELHNRYPELRLTAWTVRAIKEELAFVAPACRRSLLKVRLRGAERTVDISEAVSRATETIVAPLVSGLRALLRSTASDETEEFLSNILLVGGGAEIRGLGERLELELEAAGCEAPVVRRVVNSTLLAARGALRRAEALPESEWGTPLFRMGWSRKRTAIPEAERDLDALLGMRPAPRAPAGAAAPAPSED